MPRDVVILDGGIGRVICATPAIHDHIVITPHLQVFENNPNVYRLLHPDTPYLFEDYIQPNRLIHPEPYQHDRYYRSEVHLVQAFNYLINGVYDNALPSIYLTCQEISKAETYIKNTLKPGKKVLLFQPFGAGNWYDTSGDTICNCDSTNRSLSEDQANYIISKLSAKYEIIYIGTYFAKPTEGFYTPELTTRDIFALCKVADAFIGIDSFLMHAAAAFTLPGTVFFGSMNTKNLCYDYQQVVHRDNLVYEPMRMPVNMSYSKKNTDAMNFSFEEIDNALRTYTG